VDIKKILGNTFLFKNLDSPLLGDLSAQCRQLEFRRGEALFSEGESAATLFIIAYGKVKVFKLSESGNEHILHIHTDREIVAEAAVFDSGIYPAYCFAVQDTKVISVDKNSLVNFIKIHPEVALKFMASYSRRLRSFVEKIEYLSLSDVKERFLKYLKKHSYGKGDYLVTNLSISKKELALYLGTTPETISRITKQLVNSNMLEVKDKNYFILKQS
jgi:CRP/FNR family transcriptional regulator